MHKEIENHETLLKQIKLFAKIIQIIILFKICIYMEEISYIMDTFF